MKTIKAARTLKIPDTVKLTVKSRVVRVKGPRGVLTKNFSHVKIDLFPIKKGTELRAEVWFGTRQELATIRTVLSHIQNMITGVTKGYLYKMRMVYAHFPISVTVEKEGRLVEIRNYLGEKIVRTVPMIGDAICKRSEDGTKDEIIVFGSDIESVSQSAANIQQSTKVRDKDIRKFLDGVYVSYKGNIVQEE